jgi:hypothetical protein
MVVPREADKVCSRVGLNADGCGMIGYYASLA